MIDRASHGSEQGRLDALAAYDVIGAGSADPTIADLTALCELGATVAGVPTATVNLIDERFQHRVAAFGTDPTPCLRDEAMCETTLAGGEDVVLGDAGADPRFAGSPWVDGRLGRIRLYCSVVLRSPDGHALGTLCVFDERPHDLTPDQVRGVRLLAGQVVDALELRLRSAQLARGQAELSRSQDRLTSFAGQLSHDLKGPITAILGFAELLAELDMIADDGTASDYVARCVSAARRMQATIDELLAFARVGAADVRQRVPLDAVVPDALADLRELADAAQVSWSGPDLLGDPGQLRALLRHLLSNAITYRGERPCVVRVTSERLAQGVVLRVTDNGPGIAESSRDEVVRPLVRLRTEVPGAGLGLAVCARIAAAHRGSLRIGETEGGGTTVTVVLP